MPSFSHNNLALFDKLEIFISEDEKEYFPFHFHEAVCVVLVTKGTERLQTIEKEYYAPAGAIIVLPAKEVHQNTGLDNAAYSYKTLYLNPEMLRYCNKGKEVPSLERVIDNQQLFHQLQTLIDHQDKSELQWATAFKSLLQHTTDNKNEVSADSFNLIEEIINNYPDTPIQAEWLARQFCMSKYHFIRTFKQSKGVTPQTYILIKRLERAKKMMKPSISLNEVAWANGFYDNSHFHHYFKKYFGTTPGSYLKGLSN